MTIVTDERTEDVEVGHLGWEGWHKGEHLDCEDCLPRYSEETSYRDTGWSEAYQADWQLSRELHR